MTRVCLESKVVWRRLVDNFGERFFFFYEFGCDARTCLMSVDLVTTFIDRALDRHSFGKFGKVSCGLSLFLRGWFL